MGVGSPAWSLPKPVPHQHGSDWLKVRSAGHLEGLLPLECHIAKFASDSCGGKLRPIGKAAGGRDDLALVVSTSHLR